MKKSELIQSIIYNALSWDGLKIDSSGVPLEEIVSDILDVCERAGMMPPKVNVGDYLTHDEYFWEDDLQKQEQQEAEDMLSKGMCPCGNTDTTGCSVTGCALYLHNLEKDKK